MRKLIQVLLVIAFIGIWETRAANAQTWTQKGLDLDLQVDDFLGLSSFTLSSDGNTLATGDPNLKSDNGTDAGHVRIYTWDGLAWSQKGEDLVGDAIDDYFGFEVSLSSDGSIVAIGAMNKEGLNWNGYVRVFLWNGTDWIQKGSDLDG